MNMEKDKREKTTFQTKDHAIDGVFWHMFDEQIWTIHGGSQ